MVVYYEDKATNTRVAQNLIVIAPDDRAAVEMVKKQIGAMAAGGRITAIQFADKAPVTPGIVYRGDPYIPFSWPSMENSGRPAAQ